MNQTPAAGSDLLDALAGLDPAWADALLAAALVAVAPHALGGVALRAQAGPVRERWLAWQRAWLPQSAPMRRLPLHVGEDRLLGGLDLAATLNAGRPVVQRGLLAEADGGLVVAAMAERLPASTAAHLSAVLDTGEAVLERDGLGERTATRPGVIALDEGDSDEEQIAPALAERLAFHLDLSAVSIRQAPDLLSDAASTAAELQSRVEHARALLPQVRIGEDVVEALCGAAVALGVDSLHACLHAVRAARVCAALRGSLGVSAGDADSDAAVAARLVLAARATRVPPSDEASPPQEDEAPPPPTPDDQAQEPPPDDATRDEQPQALDDLILAAATAAIPAGLLARLKLGSLRRSGRGPDGRAGTLAASARRGRPTGSRPGDPRGGARLDLIETLRAAAPWQRVRQAEAARAGLVRHARVDVRSADFRIRRLKQRTATTTLFVLDASGSSALHRMAEAKGAVELLLAECYVRRDQVAVIGFRGAGAELLLPPTRSLVRAKRSLAGLPGGGGTPLASAIDSAARLVDTIRRSGATPVLVFLTDGRANIARDGTPGRARAEEDALQSARLLRIIDVATVLVDTSPKPEAAARRLAGEMGAAYLALPHAAAHTLSQAVIGAQAGAAAGRRG